MNKRSVMAGTLALLLCVSDVAAATKDVGVFGARSLNDAGSDLRTSMDDLKSDYSAFKNTDSLTEYFHNDQPPSVKTNVTEAQAWLVDNGVISRDNKVTVSSISASAVPSVSITKSDITAAMYENVTRSDAIMYLYKGVFGPLTGRVIGVETANVRNEGGVEQTMASLFAKHKTETYDPTNIAGIKSNSGYTWNYTPQGDEYESIFGDTNIFISDIDMDFRNGGTGNAQNGTAGDSVYGDGGDVNNEFNWETNYKQIYYKLGADTWFYRTTDVLEMYLQAAESKGVLSREKALRSANFNAVVQPYVGSTTYAPWSGSAYPYLLNRSKTGMYRSVNAVASSISTTLGVNYSVNFNGSTLEIVRNNFMTGTSGYFTNESITKMEIYRLIYDFVYANEKKLSELEADIVNYKYSMQLDGVASEEDIKIIKYLIAKGILNFDGSADFSNLQAPVRWEDFIAVLYRVANKDARLDFSVIQLTDSDQQWKAKGFYPQSVAVVGGNLSSSLAIEYTPEYSKTLESEVVSAESTRNSMSASNVQFARSTPAVGVGSIPDVQLVQSMTAADVKYADPTVAYTAGHLDSWGLRTYQGTNFDSYGMLFNWDPNSDYYLPDVLEHYLEMMVTSNDWQAKLKAVYSTGYSEAVGRKSISVLNDPANYKFIILHDICFNLYTMALLQNNPTVRAECQNRIRKFIAEHSTESNKNYYATAVSAANGIMAYLNKASNGKCGTSNIKFTVDGRQLSTLSSLHNANGATSSVWKSLEGLTVASFVSDQIGVTPVTLTLERPFVYSGGMDEDAIASMNRVAVCIRIPQTNTSLTSKTPEQIILELQQSLGTTLSDLGGTARTIETYTDLTGKDAFVSWSSIAEYNAKATAATKIPIQQISESLLYNSETDTYAYFSSKKESKIALVGTTIVSGDDELGVAYKTGDGEGATYYYHMNAIRLLMDAQQETAVLSGTHALTTADKNIKASITKASLLYESGVSNLGSLVGIRALMSSNDALSVSQTAIDSVYRQGYLSGSFRYGDFVSLSQANRVMNVISRRLQWTGTDGKLATGYAVVFFNPVPVESLGTAAVTSKTTLQELLNMPASPPSDPVAKKTWTENKTASNAYANWVYGTSGKTYLETGYVKPQAYLYVIDQNMAGKPPDATFGNLGKDNEVKVISLGKYFNGCVTKLGGAVTNTAKWRSDNAASYFLSTDYRVLVAGDRVYVNDGVFSNITLLSTGQYSVTNQTATGVGFTYGSEFLSKNSGTSASAPRMSVAETKSDGTVVCQVGPFYGIPLNDGTPCLIDRNNVSGVNPVSASGYSSSATANVLMRSYASLFKGYSGIKYEGIMTTPSQSSSNSSGLRLVYNGTAVSAYFPKEVNITGRPVTISTGTAKDLTVDDYVTALNGKFSQAWRTSSASANNVIAYFKVSFPAYKFSVVNGVLTQKSSDASDFLSAACFSNLNDLIISAMIDESNGAIAVNNIPAGSLLELGNAYYAASGTSTADKTFYGYAYINNLSGVHVPVVQDAGKAFAGQLILGGNQYVGVSQYFSQFEVLKGMTDKQKISFNLVSTNTLSQDNTTKICVDGAGNTTTITRSHDLGGSYQGKQYAPVRIKFQDKQLFAYRVGSQTSSVPMYRLCPTAENSVSGPFSKLPFYTNSILDAALFDRTLEVMSANYTEYERASGFTDRFKADFIKAFEGDLVTLGRMVTFLVLMWLIVASWACYACKFANILPVIQGLKNPGKTGSQKGLDLFKIMTLGTISVDDDLHLGKFLQYQLILAALLLVVRYTGKIIV